MDVSGWQGCPLPQEVVVGVASRCSPTPSPPHRRQCDNGDVHGTDKGGDFLSAQVTMGTNNEGDFLSAQVTMGTDTIARLRRALSAKNGTRHIHTWIVESAHGTRLNPFTSIPKIKITTLAVCWAAEMEGSQVASLNLGWQRRWTPSCIAHSPLPNHLGSIPSGGVRLQPSQPPWQEVAGHWSGCRTPYPQY